MASTEGPPSWWLADREHVPALLALGFIQRSHHIRHDHEAGWIIDFEAAWAEPMSSGERILVALAWCLFNLSWAAGVEEVGEGPLYWSNPSQAAGTLGGRHLALYMRMIQVSLGVDPLSPALSPWMTEGP